MKKLAVFLWILASFFVYENVQAAILFDSTNASSKPAQYGLIKNSWANNCGTGIQEQYGEYEFEYTTTSQMEISTFYIRTTDSIGGNPLCIEWENGNGDTNESCGFTVAGTNATTTIIFDVGERPFVYPYGTPLRMRFHYAESLSSTTTISMNARSESGFPEITAQRVYAFGGESCTATLTAGTHGVPMLRFDGGASAVFPGLIAPTLPPTSTSITEQCPDFGIFTPLCDAVVWFFVPNTDQLGAQTSYLYGLAQTKFPFSYILSVHSALTDNSAPATTTELTVSIDLPHTTTTSFGDFMPSVWVGFSTSTVMGYTSPEVWAALRFLIQIALYAEVIAMVYFGALKLIEPQP